MVRKKVIRKNRKNGKKMEREVKLILGGIGAIALLLVGIIVVLTVDFEPEEVLPEPEKHPNLFIDDVRFVNSKSNTRSNEDDHTVEATVFFTNNGDATSNNVALEVFAMVADTNMAEDSASENVGNVASMKTKKATFTLDLPKGKEYKVDLLVFEDGMITKKGYGTVKIEEESDVSAQQFKTTETKKNWNWTDDDSNGAKANSEKDESDSGTIGIMVLLITLVVIVIVIISAMYYQKKKKNEEEPPNPEFYMENDESYRIK